MDWNSTISNDGGDFTVLEPGVYPFRVKTFERAYYNGGANIPPCPMAKLVLRVGSGAAVSDVFENLYLDDVQEWKLCQFFTAIGDRKHGETLQPDWDNIVGKTGWCRIKNREYTKDGETRTTNQVEAYLDPADAPQQQQAPAPAPQQAAPAW